MDHSHWYDISQYEAFSYQLFLLSQQEDENLNPLSSAASEDILWILLPSTDSLQIYHRLPTAHSTPVHIVLLLYIWRWTLDTCHSNTVDRKDSCTEFKLYKFIPQFSPKFSRYALKPWTRMLGKGLKQGGDQQKIKSNKWPLLVMLTW